MPFHVSASSFSRQNVLLFFCFCFFLSVAIYTFWRGVLATKWNGTKCTMWKKERYKEQKSKTNYDDKVQPNAASCAYQLMSKCVLQHHHLSERRRKKWWRQRENVHRLEWKKEKKEREREGGTVKHTFKKFRAIKQQNVRGVMLHISWV